MNADPINAEALRLIMRNEGCRLAPYHDSVGVLTIGYGHTGPDIAGPISQEEADRLLEQDLDRFEQGVDEAIGDAPTTDNQFGAMVSLAYNVGLGNFRASSVRRLHCAGDYAAAADAFLLWNKAGGEVLEGLDRRRHEERALYLKPDTDSPCTGKNKQTFIQWIRKELGL